MEPQPRTGDSRADELWVRLVDNLLSEYECFFGPDGGSDDHYHKSVQAIRNKRKAGQSITRHDAYTLERCLAMVRPEDALRRRAWSDRDRFRLIAGDEVYAVYLASNPPDPTAKPVDALRADLAHLVDQVYWSYA